MAGTPVQPDPFPITAAQLTASFCESLFYGIYLVTCALCARTLLVIGSGREERWVRSHEVRWMMLGIAIALFIVCTLDVALGLSHNFRAFINSTNAEEQFTDITSWFNITKSLSQCVTIIICDYILVYRCWIVYGNQWLIIIPSLILYLGNLAVIARFFGLVASLRGNGSGVTVAASQFQPWVLALSGTTAIQNILTTGILIWRIWSVEKQSGKHRSRSWFTTYRTPSLRQVILVIGESGAIYTTGVFVCFIMSALQSNALYPTSSMTLQLAGIAFNMILIRSSPSRDQEFTEFEHRRRTANHDETGDRSGTFARSIIIFQRTRQDTETGLEPDIYAHEISSQNHTLPENERVIGTGVVAT